MNKIKIPKQINRFQCNPAVFKLIWKPSIYYIICLLVLTISIKGLGQDPTPTPTPAPQNEATPTPTPKNDVLKELDERIEILQKKKQIAQLEKETFAEEKARITSMLPTPSITPLTGKVDTDDKVVFESEMIAYKSLTEITNEISSRIKATSPRPNSLIVYNEDDIKALQSYNVIKNQIKGTKERYDDLMPGSGSEFLGSLLLAPEAATAFTKSIIEFVSLFKTDVEIKGLTFNIDEPALVAGISKGLQNSQIAVYYPKMYPIRLIGNYDSELIEALSDLYLQRSKASLIIARCEGSDEAQKQTCMAQYGANLSTLKALNQQFDKFFESLLQVDDTSKTTPLVSLLKSERVLSMFRDNNSNIYFIQLKVLKAAGSNKKKTNLFTGTKLYHSGGTIVQFILFDKDGSIKLADTLYNYDGFIKIENKAGNLVKNF